MYIFIDEYNVKEYGGEVLKRYVNKSLVKAISNPTEQELMEFGYKPIIESDKPTYNEETQYLLARYIDREDGIQRVYEVVDIPVVEEGVVV